MNELHQLVGDHKLMFCTHTHTLHIRDPTDPTGSVQRLQQDKQNLRDNLQAQNWRFFLLKKQHIPIDLNVMSLQTKGQTVVVDESEEPNVNSI